MPISRTKLRSAKVPPDFVLRPSLLELLEKGRCRPLTLVSAPAGYGKTTLVSHWLQTTDWPSAWVSLDEGDSDLRVFLDYVVTALQGIFPDACEATRVALNAPELPGSTVMAGILGNDLEKIEAHFLLALDDFHRVRGQCVPELIDRLLAHTPRSLCLVLLTRRDPALSLHALRGKHLLTEIRLRDLRFDRPETALFLEQAVDISLDLPSLERLQRAAEGWPVALRLAALALGHDSDVHRLLAGATGDLLQVQEYLVAEVLSYLSRPVQDCLYRLSILESFCASLSAALCSADAGAQGEASSMADFRALLQGSGLLCIALDERQEWFRYHHLFRQVLRGQLEARLSGKEIAALHERASAWFEQRDGVEEALSHAIEAGKPDRAAAIVKHRGRDAAVREEWSRLARWLEGLPLDIVEEDPDLLILQAKSCDKRGRYSEWVRTLEKVETMLERTPAREHADNRRRGETLAMRAMLLYHAGQGRAALDHAEQALQLLPPESVSDRAYTLLALAPSRQMVGDFGGAFAVIDDALQSNAARSPTFHGRLLQTLAFMHWIAADLSSLTQTAVAIEQLGHRHHLQETIDYSRYFRGAALYHLNELDSAEQCIVAVTEDFFGPSLLMHLMCVQISSLIHQARGNLERSRALSDNLVVELLEGGNTSFLTYAQAVQAEIALRQGQIAAALRWARQFNPGEAPAGYRFSAPALTAAKVFLQSGTDVDLQQANELLSDLRTLFESSHNHRFLIETLALQAMLCEARAEQKPAVELLGKAFSLAQRGGFIRLFVDLGPSLLAPLNRLELDEEGNRYLGQILSGFRDALSATGKNSNGPSSPTESDASRRDPIDPLSGREMDVLHLMAQRLTNSSIAERLNISPRTVKRHTENIYSKLGVHTRWEAVAKAQGIGLLSH